MKRLAALLLALVALLLLPAQPAFAHAALLESGPADGVLLQESPDRIVLRFSERVATSLGAVRVVAPDGSRADTGRADTRQGGKQVVAPLRDDLSPGTYLLLWRVVSEDSHPVSGASTFSVGRESPVATAVPDQNAGGAAGQLLTVSRGVLYAGLVLLVGGAAFVLVVWRAGQQVRAVRQVLWTGWGLAAAASAAGLLLQGPYAAGLPLSDAPGLLDDVLDTRFGAATATRLAVLAGAAVLLSRRLTPGRRGVPADPPPRHRLTCAPLPATQRAAAPCATRSAHLPHPAPINRAGSSGQLGDPLAPHRPVPRMRHTPDRRAGSVRRRHATNVRAHEPGHEHDHDPRRPQ